MRLKRIYKNQEPTKMSNISLLTFYSLYLAPLLILAAITPENYITYESLQTQSTSFLVRCNLDNGCSNILLPFIVYALNAYHSSKEVMFSWVGVLAILTLYLSHQLSHVAGNLIVKLSAMLIWLASLWLTHIGTLDLTAIPCIASFLIVGINIKNQSNWHLFSYLTALFNLTIGIVLLVCLLFYLAITSSDKKSRVTMLALIKIIIYSSVIVIVYLLLIGYNFFN